MDRLLTAAGSDAGDGSRLLTLASAEQRLLDSYALAPLYFAVSRRLVSRRVNGSDRSPMNHNYSKLFSL